MGFQSPQFDFIEQRFTHLHNKALEVICTREVQAANAAPSLVTLADGVALNRIINTSTGQLQPGVRVIVTDIDPGVAVFPNKVCNIFAVTYSIVEGTGAVLAGPSTVVASDAVDCPGAGLGGGETVVQKHDIQINPCLTPVDTNEDNVLDALYITFDIEYCLVVARETVLKVEAARPFCP